MRREEAKSVVVLGVRAGGKKNILRRFPIKDEGIAAEWALRQPMKDYEDIVLERSRVDAELGKFLPQKPLRADHSGDVSFVLDAAGSEVLSVRGPKGYRQAICSFALTGSKSPGTWGGQ